MEQKTAQEKLKDLMESGNDDSNETVQIMEFMRDNSTPLTQDQVSAFMLLNENDLGDIAGYAHMMKQTVTPFNIYDKTIKALTMADRIKGNAKLSHLMKANANPASTALKPEDVQAKGASRKEMEGR